MLVLPVGGQASFYSDWLKEDRGEHVGPPGSQGWADHDPELLLDNLRDTTVFV